MELGKKGKDGRIINWPVCNCGWRFEMAGGSVTTNWSVAADNTLDQLSGKLFVGLAVWQYCAAVETSGGSEPSTWNGDDWRVHNILNVDTGCLPSYFESALVVGINIHSK